MAMIEQSVSSRGNLSISPRHALRCGPELAHIQHQTVLNYGAGEFPGDNHMTSVWREFGVDSALVAPRRIQVSEGWLSFWIQYDVDNQ